MSVTIVALPYRAAPDLLQRERTRLTATPGAEDTVYTSVATSDPGNGRWTLVESREPDRISAFAAWVGGAPAAGGLGGRLQQARDSLLGAPYVPVLMGLAPSQPAHLSGADRQRALSLIQQFIDAQAGLSASMAAASRVPGRS